MSQDNCQHSLISSSLVLSGLLLCCPLQAQNKPTISVSPTEIRLNSHNPQQQLLVTATEANGSARDLTENATYRVADGTIAAAQSGLVTALRDGQTDITIQVGELKLSVAVVVTKIQDFPPVHFGNDIVPILTKYGCNSGGCHGSQAGQNGFKLSVFGYDPVADYNALVKESRGRRVFPASTDRSLFIAKATGSSVHGGGQRIDPDSNDAHLLRSWLAQGMPKGAPTAPTLQRITVTPTTRTIATNTSQQLQVEAVYSDGNRRDVTHSSAYTSNLESIVSASQQGLMHSGNRSGEAAITINYMGKIAVTRLIIPRSNTSPTTRPDWFSLEHPIDKLVFNKWQQLRLQPSAQIDDYTFLRRLLLVTSGTLPTTDDINSYINHSATDKREQMIQAALNRPEYSNYWAQRWADILMVNPQLTGQRGAFVFHNWIHDQISSNRPYDQWVRELISASGNTGLNGPANFYRVQRSPEDLTTAISQAFLGIRLDCAQCHHHPFEKWGQDDFWGMAGFFNGVKRQKLDDQRELVFNQSLLKSTIPVLGQEVAIQPPGGMPLPVDFRGDPRRVLAKWVTSPDNPFFTKLVVNRIWKHLMGRGLVEPEDDLRMTNPATNEPLLDHLAGFLVDNQYNIRALMNHILTSKSFQVSSRTNATNFDDSQNYSHYITRRIPAEALLDAIAHSTGVPERYAGHQFGTRAIELWDNQLPSYFLDTFGRSERKSPCECGSSGAPTMAQALHLLNAPEIESKIQSDAGQAAKLASSELTKREIVSFLCLHILGKPATTKHHQVASLLFAGNDRRQAIEDYVWTLMNSYDFLFIQ